MSLSRRASALPTVLILLVAILPLLLVVAAIWCSQFTFMGGDEGRDGCRRLAESALRLAIARTLSDSNFGASHSELIKVSLPAYAGGSGVVSYRSDTPGVPQSYNNLGGASSISGSGGSTLPDQQAQLVAVGSYRGCQETVEAILHVPKFPYVVGSSVPISSTDGLQVFGIRTAAALANGFDHIDPKEIVPGHLLTNAPGDNAMGLLGTGTKIRGNAISAGKIYVSGGASVSGDILEYSQPVALPKIDFANLDTAGSPGLTTLSGNALGQTTLSGFVRCDGNLLVSEGLQMQAAVLYVTGDVNVSGGLSGTGAIISLGRISVSGGGSLATDNKAALLARGNIQIQGTPQQRAEFHGVIYSESGLQCRHVNLAGTALVNSPDSNQSASFYETTLAQNAEIAQISFPVQEVTATPGETYQTVPPALPYVPLDLLSVGVNPLLVSPGQEPGRLSLTVEGMAAIQNYNTPARVAANGGWTVPPGQSAETLFRPTIPLAASSLVGNSQATTIGQVGSAGLSNLVTAVGGTPNPNGFSSQMAAANALLPEILTLLQSSAASGTPSAPTTVTVPAGSLLVSSQGSWSFDLSRFLKTSERIRILCWRRMN